MLLRCVILPKPCPGDTGLLADSFGKGRVDGTLLRMIWLMFRSCSRCVPLEPKYPIIRPIECVICVCKLRLYDWTYGILKLGFVVAMVTLPPASFARVGKLVKGWGFVGVNDIGLPNGRLPEPINGPGMSWSYIRP